MNEYSGPAFLTHCVDNSYRQMCSQFTHTPISDMRRPTYTEHVWRQQLRAAGRRVWNNLSTGSRRHDRTIQTTTENISLCELIRRCVTVCLFAPWNYCYLLTYLLTYLKYNTDFCTRHLKLSWNFVTWRFSVFAFQVVFYTQEVAHSIFKHLIKAIQWHRIMRHAFSSAHHPRDRLILLRRLHSRRLGMISMKDARKKLRCRLIDQFIRWHAAFISRCSITWQTAAFHSPNLIS